MNGVESTGSSRRMAPRAPGAGVTGAAGVAPENATGTSHRRRRRGAEWRRGSASHRRESLLGTTAINLAGPPPVAMRIQLTGIALRRRPAHPRAPGRARRRRTGHARGRCAVKRADAGASAIDATLDAPTAPDSAPSLSGGKARHRRRHADLRVLCCQARCARCACTAKRAFRCSPSTGRVRRWGRDSPRWTTGSVGGTAAGPQLVIGPLLARLASGSWIIVPRARTARAGRPGIGRRCRYSNINLLVRGSGLTTRHAIDGVSLKGLSAGAGLASARCARAHATAHRVGERRLHLLSPGGR